MQKIISRVFLILAILLSGPALAIMATWNTLPGEQLYPLKRNLEKTAGLFLSPSYKASSELEIKLISRRLGETEKTIDQSSSAGLKELVSQAQSARKTVLGTTNTKAQKENTAKLITELRTAQNKLQEKKQAISTTPFGDYQNPQTKTVTNVVNITNIVYQQKNGTINPETDGNQPTPQPDEPETPEDIVDEIDGAEQEIEDIINDLEERAANEQGGASLQSVDQSTQIPEWTTQETPTQPDTLPGRSDTRRQDQNSQSDTQNVPQTPEPVVTPELTPTQENL